MESFFYHTFQSISFHTCSVKIWMSNKEDLQNSVEVYKSSFFLLKEVKVFISSLFILLFLNILFTNRLSIASVICELIKIILNFDCDPFCNFSVSEVGFI